MSELEAIAEEATAENEFTNPSFEGIYKKGFLAALEGRDRSENPHDPNNTGPQGTTFSRAFHRYWNDGYDDGERRSGLEAGLSEQQAEIVRLKKRGVTHAKIAERLGVSKGSVDKQSHRVLERAREAEQLLKLLEGLYRDRR